MDEYRNLGLSNLNSLALKLSQSFKNNGGLIGLVGPLGSGKTTFIKKFAKGLGIKRVSSPTFVISHEYKLSQRKYFHLDFYRLHKASQLIPIGIDDMLTQENIVIAEWIDRFPKLMKRADVIIILKVRSKNKRDVTIKTKK